MELLLLLLVFGAVMAEEDEPRDRVTYTNIKDVPVVESFAGSLLQSTELKPQVLGAFNISAEVDDWISSGKPTTLGFVEDNDVVKYGIIAANQFVPYSNYIGGIRFHFYNKYDEMDLKGFPFIRVGVLSERGWDPKLPLKVLVHGFGNNIKSPSIQLIKNAYLKKGKYNVIGVDWGRLAGAPLYVATRVHVSAVATRLAHLMDSLVKAKLTEVPLIHLVGYDMGAHVAGIVGKSMAVGKPKRITGLDPNLPLFTLTKSEGKLDKTDADIVDVIHTSPGFIGFEEALGKVDFYPSGSLDCSADVFGACAHARSYEIFAQSIEKSLPAHYCGATFKEVKECTTTKEVKKTATMGDALQFDKEGTYTFSWVKMAM